MGKPTVHPTGVVLYKPEKCYGGYTIMPIMEKGATLINMNGKEEKVWKNFQGMPNKILPGGYVMGSRSSRDPQYGYQESADLSQVDWDGNVVWEFRGNVYVEDPGYQPCWMALQHHDYQREGSPVGYYAPGLTPKVDCGNTLVLCHRLRKMPKISDKTLIDDTFLEVNWQGEVIWQWSCLDHFKEYGFDEMAKNAIYREPNMVTAQGGLGDWMHINSMSTLGPNKWYDAGDERFHPDNIIWDGRETNILAITSKKTGEIVWKIGPDYTASKELRRMGVIIGQHHAHMIPRGLPGEGNILVYDNGGWAGYGAPSQTSPVGVKAVRRDHTRILEINPLTLKIVWQYTPSEAGYLQPFHSHYFYSPFISSAQRLPNGNTLITEGSGGHLLEVTKSHELVWEYVSPYWSKVFPLNMIYRAYRVPYEWIPQLDRPTETAIVPPDNNTWRLPGAAGMGCERETEVPGTTGYEKIDGFCVQIEEAPPVESDDEYGGEIRF